MNPHLMLEEPPSDPGAGAAVKLHGCSLPSAPNDLPRTLSEEGRGWQVRVRQ